MQVKGVQTINDWHLIVYHEEEFMLEFAEEGETFIDVGAHVGAWTLKLGKYFKNVFSYEPNPEAFNVLKQNIELNEMKNVDCINKAVGNEDREIELTLYEHPSHSTILTHHPMEDHCGKIKDHVGVKMIRIDDQHFDNVSLIKIDVEGYEVEVVKGALKTIEKFKPRLLIEIHSEENEKIIKDLLPNVKFTTKSNETQPYLIS